MGKVIELLQVMLKVRGVRVMRAGRLLLAVGKKLRRGIKVFPVAGGIAKLEFYNNLRKSAEVADDGVTTIYPAGYVHLPKVDAEYLQQLCAEQLITRRDRNGFAHREWQKMRERNEALEAADKLKADNEDQKIGINIVRKALSIGADILLGDHPDEARILRSATPHWFRHTFTTIMSQLGTPLPLIQHQLRHESIATTAIYTHSEKHELYRAVAKLTL